jgi:hypothetical protein
MKTITNTMENNELQVKESWSKPQIAMININEETLGTFGGVGSDGGIYS